jgi:uncharacterized protein YceH (UPF0502 family)
MKTIIAAAIALTVSQAMATTTARPTPQPSMQQQIEALKNQVAALQQQIDPSGPGGYSKSVFR